ncbi:PAS domain-containing protein [Costertonia aggregata]|uniref:PAS domain-containing protein n=1 Tax=Costertonia aggregata TaxID=343403 RepID=A0A7H9APZ0_9FLAO|nr:PAS domain-containing protein [Costertonia aggregata]QLG45487.1 PAS domain-containing protein [Costertonia aggregata]
MSEIKNYDRAAHKYYMSQNITGLPITSWDLFGPYFDTLCKNYNDLVAIRHLASENRWSYSSPIEENLIQDEQIIVITDAKLNIVHATNNISGMNGYTPQEILGKSPKMFQGEKTCRETQKHISKAIKESRPFEATVVNYRKDGSIYNCWIKAEPIFNEKGKVVNFIAYEKEVA